MGDNDGVGCPNCDLTTTSASALANHHKARHGSPLPDGFYLNEIHKLAEELGSTPSVSDMRERGRFSAVVYRDRFGCWNDAIAAAGLRPNQVQVRFSDTEILDEIQALADDLGRVPFKSEFQEKAAMSATAVQTHFDSWNAAVREAGFLPSGSGNTSLEKEDLIAAIQQLTEELGHPPRGRHMTEQGAYSIPSYLEKFGSWHEAVRAAGYEPLPRFPTGEDHWTWDGGSLPYGEGWNNKKKRKVRTRDQARCQHCGRTEPEHLAEFGMKHHVHHITPARDVDDPAERNAMENLITLCQGQCHKTWEQMAPLRPDTAAAAD